jgi:CRISPR-associated protein Csc3
LDLTQKLAEYLELSADIPALRQIQSLKKTGGVPLDWYYLAAQYFRNHPGLDFAQILDVMKGMVNHAASLIRPIIAEFHDMPDGWDDLKTYVSNFFTYRSSFKTITRLVFSRIKSLSSCENYR